MRRMMTTAALVAALCAASPLTAQETEDLQRLIEDAIEREAVAGDTEPASVFDPAPEPDRYSEAELDALLAPVALYPDALLAQVLVASTYPLQIVQADRILARSDALSDDELSEEIESRDWDPSVLVLLTGFPDVIRRMAEDLDDTERLGVAMAEQDRDVLDSVQRLRLQAEETGWLADNEAQVVRREADRIVIEPADEDVIYVPRYDAQRAFVSAPTASPVVQRPGAGDFLSNPLVAGGIGFGSALLISELFGDDESDNDNDGWDDYWRRDRRAIDWNERQLYPRAYAWDDETRRGNASWSRERDRAWDRDTRRWRDDVRRAERRDDRDRLVWQARRDPESGRVTFRPRDAREFRAAVERREERIADIERAEDRARREAEERRQRRAREAREERVEERQETQDERAAERRREERQEELREKRADEERRGERQQERAEEQRREERQEERAAEELREKRQQQRAEEERREERQEERAAQELREERQQQRAEEERRKERQAERAAQERREERAGEAEAPEAAAAREQRRDAEARRNADQKQRAARQQAERDEAARRERERADQGEERATQDRAKTEARGRSREAEEAQREETGQRQRQQAEGATTAREAQAERERAQARERERVEQARAQDRAGEGRDAGQAQPRREAAEEQERRPRRGRDCAEGPAGRECRRGG